jgi:4-hydroxy-tetrahydrodipicolinate synthase
MNLGGFIPPIATPMRNGAIDYDSLDGLVDYLRDSVSGYLVGGSVGEHPSLSLDEREALTRAVARRRASDRSLAVSVADNCLENCRRMVRDAQDAGTDLLMVSCPNYYVNTLPMLIAYFSELGSYSSVPLCLYDNPIASHTTLSVADIIALAQAVPALRAIKVTDPSPEKVRALREGTDLVVHAGDDFVLWHMLARGAHGGMVALPMIYPEESRTIWSALQREDWAAAEAAYRRTSHFIHIALGAPDYVPVIKTVLHHRGVIASPEVRVPILPLSEERRAEVLRALPPTVTTAVPS